MYADRSLRSLSLLTLLTLLAGAPLGAAGVKLFSAQDRDAFLAGTLDGLSIDSLGALTLATRVESLARIEEPFAFDASASDRAWMIGTGNGGRVVRVDAGGEVETLWQADEPEVFAVWADPDGAVYAGSSPGGAVVRLVPGDEPVEVFRPEATYIWDLVREPDGDLLVATGLPGHLYRLGRDDSAPELLLDAGDRHVRTVLPLDDGRLLIGTAGQGLVLEQRADGSIRTLLDSPYPEVLAFAPDGRGGAFVALLASEASYVDLSAGAESDGNGDTQDGEAVSVQTEGQATLGSRGAGFTGPRSVLMHLDAAGTAEEVWAFEAETVHALAWHDRALWVGTGQEGHLYRWQDDVMVLEKDLEDRQVTALVPRAGSLGVVTTNAAGIAHMPGGLESEGTYTSPVLDAEQIAQFGAFFWRGDLPAGAEVTFAFRSGMAADPDATWTPWTAPVKGQEVQLGDVADARFVQWRATLRAGRGAGPRIAATELSYRQRNRRPKIASVDVLDPGQVLVPSNFNPQNQTYEPWSPNRDGIFTTLAASEGSDDGRTKNLWKKGYRTVKWQAEDGNEDTLRFDLAFRRAAAGGEEADESTWLPMVEDIDTAYYSFDATVLPDGVYRFRLTASDREDQLPADVLADQYTSRPVVIDHTPPELAGVERTGGELSIVVRDALSPMRDASVSVDGGAWQPAQVRDGLLDGRSESLAIPVPTEARLVLLRVTDAAWNVVTFDLSSSP